VSHPEKVLGESLITHDESTKVLEPCEHSLDLPLPLVASERAAVLRPVFSGPPMAAQSAPRRRRTSSASSLCDVEDVVADEARRERPNKPGGHVFITKLKPGPKGPAYEFN
jgi:hypothetical protein